MALTSTSLRAETPPESARFDSGIRLSDGLRPSEPELPADLEVQKPAHEGQGPYHTARRVVVAVDVHLASDSHFFCGLSGDISDGGIFISTYRPIAVGSTIDIELSLPGVASAVQARGRVRFLREHSAHEPRGVGIAFEELEASDAKHIHAFCSLRPPLYYDDVG